jgi:hypothetical protein
MFEKSKKEDLETHTWDFEAEQNWLGFCDLIVKEFMRQKPEEYKKIKDENNKNI